MTKACNFIRVQKLPIDEYLPKINQSLERHNSLVLVAAPGAGKTTRVPPALLALLKQNNISGEIIMLQPRRIAARAASARIAAENGWELGKEVGYQVRFDNFTSAETRIRVVTEGILVRQLQSSPELAGVAAVILDEFHERSIHSDLAIALLKELQESLRPDLKIIVMSATIDAERVAKFLNDCPIFNVPGKLFDIETTYAKAPLPLRCDDEFISRVCDVAREHILNSSDGHTLVFLPGMGEIQRCIKQFETFAQSKSILTLALHGSLNADEQDRVLQSSLQRKMIFTTNIAETSLTIDGVNAVIDSGFARIIRVNFNTGLEHLELARISRASATQRSGRSGRQMPGKSYRLWTKLDEAAFALFEEPEIRRIDLADTLLQIHSWGVADVTKFNWFEAPREQSIRLTDALLKNLGAIDSSGAVSAIGKKMLLMPLHPRLSRMLLFAGERGLLKEACEIAAILSEKDFLNSKTGALHHTSSESDILLRLEKLYDKEDRSIHRGAAQAVQRSARAIEQIARRVFNYSSVDLKKGHSEHSNDTLLELLLIAFSDRVCRRRRSGDVSARMVGGRGVKLSQHTSVLTSEFFVALDTIESSGGADTVVTIASRIEKEWLRKHFANEISNSGQVVLDEQSGRVVKSAGEFFRDLPLRDPHIATATTEEAFDALKVYLEKNGQLLSEKNSALHHLLQRLTFLNRYLDREKLPTLASINISEFLDEICYGETSLHSIFSKDLHTFFLQRLSAEQKKILAKEAPTEFLLPSAKNLRGEKVVRYAKVQYPENGDAPFLECKIQDVFGWKNTPQIAFGKVKLNMVLLAPNQRPMQITNDLESFWKSGYAEVRKELRARYPKHRWPEDPTSDSN